MYVLVFVSPLAGFKVSGRPTRRGCRRHNSYLRRMPINGEWRHSGRVPLSLSLSLSLSPIWYLILAAEPQRRRRRRRFGFATNPSLFLPRLAASAGWLALCLSCPNSLKWLVRQL